MPQTTETTVQTELSAEELKQRSAVLRRLREHFLAQRDRFQDYLSLLDQEKTAIEQGDDATLERQIELEKAIVGEIFSFQKVIDPLEHLYAELKLSNASSSLEEEHELPALRDSLAKLKESVLRSNERNQELLQARMSLLQDSIQQIRIPSRKASPYGAFQTPSMIDLGA